MIEHPVPRELAAKRLQCWIYPSHVEGVLSRIVGWAYKRGDESGWRRGYAWLGDLADDAQTRICRVRAWWHWRLGR